MQLYLLDLNIKYVKYVWESGADPGFVERGVHRERHRREALLRGSASSLIRGEKGGRAPPLGSAPGNHRAYRED